MKKVVIVGGGTGGWMAALAISGRMRGVEVEVIDPDKIPAIGVGESVTGVVQQFVADPALGLNMQDFYRRTDAALKMGIWYEGWQGEGTEYLSPIDTPSHYFAKPYATDCEDFYAMAAADGVKLGDSQIYSELMRTNRTDYVRTPEGEITGKYALASCQFDSLKFAGWIREVCARRRGIRHTDDVVTGFEQDAETGAVTELIMESGRRVAGDFFIDCTGFARTLFAKAFGVRWIDYSRWIKVDSAIPTTGEHRKGEGIPSYTRAKALGNGWMWQIPTQARMGKGYVFSSQYTGDDEAVAEMRAAGGDPGENPKILRFSPGRFEEQWRQNVCSIGLSAGFVEPLEATTIHAMVVQIQLLTELYLPNFTAEAAPSLSRQYNRMMRVGFDSYVDFVNFHYRTGRADTEFWRDYQKDEAMTEANLEKIEKWKYAFPCREDFEGALTLRAILTAGQVVWMPMLSALGYLDPGHARSMLGQSKHLDWCKENVAKYVRMRGLIGKHGVSQEEGIAFLRG